MSDVGRPMRDPHSLGQLRGDDSALFCSAFLLVRLGLSRVWLTKWMQLGPLQSIRRGDHIWTYLSVQRTSGGHSFFCQAVYDYDIRGDCRAVGLIRLVVLYY